MCTVFFGFSKLAFDSVSHIAELSYSIMVYIRSSFVDGLTTLLRRNTSLIRGTSRINTWPSVAYYLH